MFPLRARQLRRSKERGTDAFPPARLCLEGCPVDFSGASFQGRGPLGSGLRPLLSRRESSAWAVPKSTFLFFFWPLRTDQWPGWALSPAGAEVGDLGKPPPSLIRGGDLTCPPAPAQAHLLLEKASGHGGGGGGTGLRRIGRS